ncbi:sex hormone-binding globulin [Nematolebias whitei]|uniref:sex hormone-binding globulin n=1 Tax=Nematolebias whitei TaxID=451745 RepID=UPI0018976481|nr:sex hormone-binding globulin [Nematolebias whitei]
MAMFWKMVAGGLLFTVGLALLWGQVEGQRTGRDKKEVAGDSIIYLGQERDPWRPLIRTTANLSEITNIKSSFHFRTFDPEGAIFYGDTKNGEDWFVLSLRDGFPLMQISKEDVLVSVTGGLKLNDGKWHTLEVSNEGKFVILLVDGLSGLEVGMQSKQTQEVISGELRLALGGILIDKDKLIVQFEPQMDGCVREGSWLNLSIPWEVEAEELWLCYQNIQPGSYFAGKGLAVFNTSVFSIDEDRGFRVEFWGDFSQMDGTILSVKSSQDELLFTAAVSNSTKEVIVTSKAEKIAVKNSFKRLLITFLKDLVKVLPDEDESKLITLAGVVSDPGYFTTLREAQLAIGGLLGEGIGGSHFLTGCLQKIQVQGKDLDLDLSVKHMSVSSHSCPA